jgi:hypothetical protein
MVVAQSTMPLVERWRARGRHVLPYLVDFSWTFYSDAEALGRRGRLILPSGAGFDGRGYLKEWERLQSSTYREAIGVLRLLPPFESKSYRGLRIQWYSDRMNLVNDMKKGAVV